MTGSVSRKRSVAYLEFQARRGLGTDEMSMLGALTLRQDPTLAVSLADFLDMGRRGMGQRLASLQRRGFVLRSYDADRRAWLWAPTPEVRRVFAEADRG